MDHWFDEYQVEPSEKTFGLLLRLAQKTRRPQLASDLLDRMENIWGVEMTDELRELPEVLSQPIEVLKHPRLPAVEWSAQSGYFKPELKEETRKAWTVIKQPVKGGALPTVEVQKVVENCLHPLLAPMSFSRTCFYQTLASASA